MQSPELGPDPQWMVHRFSINWLRLPWCFGVDAMTSEEFSVPASDVLPAVRLDDLVITRYDISTLEKASVLLSNKKVTQSVG